MENTTPFQKKLIEDLVTEFTNINKKSHSDDKKRFSFKTIGECKKEEQILIQTLTKHNLAMMKVYINQFKNDIKAFKKEFGKVLDIQIGRDYICFGGTFEEWVEANKKRPIDELSGYEMHLYLVSKTKEYSSNNHYNYCNGKCYLKLFVDFKRELITHKLESGKVVVVHKIVGLEYCLKDFLYRADSFKGSTLDEFIQNEKIVQEKIVELVG